LLPRHLDFETTTLFTLVTGVTGYIGAWVAHEALSLGYKVRGAVRSLPKAAWLQAYFDASFPGQYTQVSLPDVNDKSAFGAAIKDVAGIAHIAANIQLTPNPEPYIPDTIEEILNLLKTAESEASVKAVVFTSSSMAGVEWDAKGTISKDKYSEGFINQAWDPSFTDPSKAFLVYAAAKAQAEKAAWKYVAEEEPHFTLNTVLPSCNMGPSLVYEKQGHPSTSGWVKGLFDGNLGAALGVPPQYFIDVRDAAKLHVAALLDPETSSERLWGFAEPYNWNTVLAAFRKIWPEKKFLEDLEGLGWMEIVPPTESALRVLRNVYGQEGWIGLEKTLRDGGYDRA
jgi:nucleoside-diphosphate-sugar epimerase